MTEHSFLQLHYRKDIVLVSLAPFSNRISLLPSRVHRLPELMNRVFFVSNPDKIQLKSFSVGDSGGFAFAIVNRRKRLLAAS